MRRRVVIGLLLAPLAARAQLLQDLVQPEDDRRAGAGAALRRTVALVLRAEARSGTLPEGLMAPEPAPLERLRVGEKLPGDVVARVLPPRINRRLPHKRDATVWAAIGDALAEIDPVRLTLQSLVPGALPPRL